MTVGMESMQVASCPMLALNCPATMLQISPMASADWEDASGAETPSIWEAILLAALRLQRNEKTPLNAPPMPITPVTSACTGNFWPVATVISEPTIMENTSLAASPSAEGQALTGMMGTALPPACEGEAIFLVTVEP
jgi:hypothetical protein